MPSPELSYRQLIHDYPNTGWGEMATEKEIKQNFQNSFKPEELRLIDQIASQIQDFKKTFPVLSHVDLVIEGGVGTGTLMREAVRLTYPYPNSFYIAMDLNSIWEQIIAPPRYKDKVDMAKIKDLQRENEQSVPAYPNIEETICANCFDYPLIFDISRKLHRRSPLLISFNAEFALEDYSWGPGDNDVKRPFDRYPIEHWFSPRSPYVAQMFFFGEPHFRASMSENLLKLASKLKFPTAVSRNGVVTVKP